MALLERSHHGLNQFICHDQLNFPFADVFDLSGSPDKRLTAVQRSKLALPHGLPGALVVGADSTATGGKYGTLDLVDMTWRNEKAELVHALNLPKPERYGTCAAMAHLRSTLLDATSSARRGTRAQGAAS